MSALLVTPNGFQHPCLHAKPSRREVFRLVRFEMFEDPDAAISGEKPLKRRHRQWRSNLIEQDNPQGIDLATGLGFDPGPPRGRRNGP